MEISDPQKRQHQEIFVDETADTLRMGINENELTVLVDSGNGEVAYTADEARDLAKRLHSASNQRWKKDNENLIEYLFDLADVVDNDKEAKNVEKKWEAKTINKEI